MSYAPPPRTHPPQNCIHTVKEQFNKEFDETLRSKVNEIARIKEKNVRISKIISQLKLDDPLVQPSLGVLEQPEQLLTVQDSEVKVEKYVSPEEQKQREEVAKLEEERRLAAMGDNPRERALDMMMGGRLEANVEEDLFKVKCGIQKLLFLTIVNLCRTFPGLSSCPKTLLRCLRRRYAWPGSLRRRRRRSSRSGRS